MNEKTARRVRIACFAAAALMALLALAFRMPGRGAEGNAAEGRIAFLADCGWEVDPASEELKSVLIPDCGAGVMADYNALQLRQGYDLSAWEGRTVTQVSYRVTNYPGYAGTVWAVLYVSGRRVIGGDIHSAALNGFMHGLRRDAGGG